MRAQHLAMGRTKGGNHWLLLRGNTGPWVDTRLAGAVTSEQGLLLGLRWPDRGDARLLLGYLLMGSCGQGAGITL
jgi:hypothetical protein